MATSTFTSDFKLRQFPLGSVLQPRRGCLSNLQLSDVLSVLSDLTFLDPSLRYRFVTQMIECDTCYPCFDSLGAWDLRGGWQS